MERWKVRLELARGELLRQAQQNHAQWCHGLDETFEAVQELVEELCQSRLEADVREATGPAFSVAAVQPSQKPRQPREEPSPLAQALTSGEYALDSGSQLGGARSATSSIQSQSCSVQLYNSILEIKHEPKEEELARQLSPHWEAPSGLASPALTAEDLNRSKSQLIMNPGFTLHRYIDYATGILVTLNFILAYWTLEWEGHSLGHLIGIPNLVPREVLALRWAEVGFDLIFLVEFSLRVYIDRHQLSDFAREFANWFDAALVLNSIVDMAVFFAGEPSYAWALVRCINALRTIRVMRAMRLFRGLRLLLKACHAFLPTLAWSMVLLGVIMSMSGVIIGRLMQSFLAGDAELEDRRWIWERYGTAYRAIYTMYEITFAGNWPTNVRPVLEKVSHLYAAFFAAYITVVVFAAIRVITAVFLKDTLDAAQSDQEHQLAEGLKKKAQYVQKLEKFFKHIDDCNTGMITESRLNDMLENPRVKAYFETLDLAVHEGTALVHILDNGDGEVTLEEFIDGILRCKGPARAIDQVAMQADLKMLDQKISLVMRSIQEAQKHPRGRASTAVDLDMDRIARKTQKKGTLTKEMRVFRLEESMETGSYVTKVSSRASKRASTD